jgi:hypothetical protein
MALKMNMVSPQGFDVQDAYLRVEATQLPQKTAMQFILRMYKDAQTEVAFDSRQFICAYNLVGGNPFNQAYNHLKTLPEFAGAVDC